MERKERWKMSRRRKNGPLRLIRCVKMGMGLDVGWRERSVLDELSGCEMCEGIGGSHRLRA